MYYNYTRIFIYRKNGLPDQTYDENTKKQQQKRTNKKPTKQTKKTMTTTITHTQTKRIGFHQTPSLKLTQVIIIFLTPLVRSTHKTIVLNVRHWWCRTFVFYYRKYSENLKNAKSGIRMIKTVKI